MALLTPNPVSTSRFTYDPASRKFVAEASDLGRGEPFGRVYDDACDVGLTLVSATTGRSIVFAVARENRDREGEVVSWDLVPAFYQSHGRGLTVRVFND